MADPAHLPWLLTTRGPLKGGDAVTLEAEEARHARGALRLRQGEDVVLADGAGMVATARLVSLSRNKVIVEVRSVRQVPRPAGRATSLAAAVLHGQAMDWTVQKAVELGVAALVPVVTARSQVALGRARARFGHWQRLALQGLKQCRRAWAMTLAEPIALDELIEQRTAEPGIVALATGRAVCKVRLGAEPILLVGPEGGLTSQELQLLDGAGWQQLRLGDHTLRAETAAVAGVVLVQAALRGDLDGGICG